MVRFDGEDMKKYFDTDFDYIEYKYAPFYKGVDIEHDSVNAAIVAGFKKRCLHYERTKNHNLYEKIDYSEIHEKLKLIYNDPDEAEMFIFFYDFALDHLIDRYLNIPLLNKLFSHHYFEYEWEQHIDMNFEENKPSYYRDHFIHQIRDCYMVMQLLRYPSNDSDGSNEFYEKILSVLKCRSNDISQYACVQIEQYADLVKEKIREGTTLRKEEMYSADASSETVQKADKITKKLIENTEDYAWRYLIQGSLIAAALFHDIGYPIRYIYKSIESVSDYISLISPADNLGFDRLNDLLEGSLLFTITDKKSLMKRYGAKDHGALSAYILLLQFYENGAIYGLDPIKRAIVELAAVIIYDHTLKYRFLGSDEKDGAKQAKEGRIMPSFRDNPLSYTLRVIDDIQESDRMYFEIGGESEYRFCEKCKMPIRSVWNETGIKNAFKMIQSDYDSYVDVQVIATRAVHTLGKLNAASTWTSQLVPECVKEITEIKDDIYRSYFLQSFDEFGILFDGIAYVDLQTRQDLMGLLDLGFLHELSKELERLDPKFQSLERKSASRMKDDRFLSILGFLFDDKAESDFSKVSNMFGRKICRKKKSLEEIYKKLNTVDSIAEKYAYLQQDNLKLRKYVDRKFSQFRSNSQSDMGELGYLFSDEEIEFRAFFAGVREIDSKATENVLERLKAKNSRQTEDLYAKIGSDSYYLNEPIIREGFSSLKFVPFHSDRNFSSEYVVAPAQRRISVCGCESTSESKGSYVRFFNAPIYGEESPTVDALKPKINSYHFLTGDSEDASAFKFRKINYAVTCDEEVLLRREDNGHTRDIFYVNYNPYKQLYLLTLSHTSLNYRIKEFAKLTKQFRHQADMTLCVRTNITDNPMMLKMRLICDFIYEIGFYIKTDPVHIHDEYRRNSIYYGMLKKYMDWENESIFTEIYKLMASLRKKWFLIYDYSDDGIREKELDRDVLDEPVDCDAIKEMVLDAVSFLMWPEITRDQLKGDFRKISDHIPDKGVFKKNLLNTVERYLQILLDFSKCKSDEVSAFVKEADKYYAFAYMGDGHKNACNIVVRDLFSQLYYLTADSEDAANRYFELREEKGDAKNWTDNDYVVSSKMMIYALDDLYDEKYYNPCIIRNELVNAEKFTFFDIDSDMYLFKEMARFVSDNAKRRRASRIEREKKSASVNGKTV